MKIIFSVIFILFFSYQSYCIIPPKHGKKPPQHVIDFQKMVRSIYDLGYYADKFKERCELREKVALGILPESVLTQDTVFALTLLGQYSNLPANYSQQTFQNLLFDGPNPTGTVTEYYNQVSYNQLHFTGSAKGWYNVPGSLEQYTGTNNGLGPQGGPRFVLDLIIEADQTLNFADYIQYYDNQGRPRIGFIAAVHSGADAAAGAYNIWSHRWTFAVITGGQPYITNDIDPVSGLPVMIDGDYAIQPEFEGSNNFNGPLITIGVFTHEFGHIFGLPDLYDTDYSSSGLGNWCLMAGGTYGGNGNTPHTPVHMSAWCKKQLGWITPINVTAALDNLSVPNVQENPVLYRTWKNSSAGPEYFLVENRQKLGFDIHLPAAGLLIYHIDETRTGNTNENRYLVDLEQADGMRQLNNGSNNGDAGDPFPGITNNTRFDMKSEPDSKDYNLQHTFVSVRNIRKDNLNMVADLDIGTKPFIDINEIYLSESTFQNGRLEPGETGNLNFSLANISPVISSTTILRFYVDEPGIIVQNNEIIFSIPAQSSLVKTFNSSIIVLPEFKSRTITIRYEISGDGNYLNDSTEVVIGIPDILIISRAEKSSLADNYKNSLLESENYFEYSFHSQFEFISSRKSIIILSGRNKVDLFSGQEIDSLTIYASNGGRIFFSGQNIAEFLHNNFSDFLNNIIGINWVKNMGPLTRNAYGISSDLFGSNLTHIRFNGSEGANNETNCDAISVNQDFNLSFTYNVNGSDPAGGWINNTSNNSKIFFLGFGFESINNNESPIKRNQLMTAILNWFDIPTKVETEEYLTLSEYSLLQNYPNPFNPVTNISYYLPESASVSLKVYEVTGREITTLVNEEKPAGIHKIEFDAGSLSSGVYFYRIETGKYSSVKKMTVIR